MRENYRLYKLYKMVQKNNGGEQPSVDIDAFLGLKPIKKLTLSNNQDKLVNHYIEKFSTCQGFEDIPYYKLTFNAKPEGNEDPTILHFSYLYLQPYLISTPTNLYAEYPVWVNYYNKNYTAAFIQLDEAMGLGFTEEFLEEKNITKEELLQMNGWYDNKLQPYTGVLEYTNLVPVFASIENAASMVGMAEVPEDAVKNCYTFDDFYLSVDVEYCNTAEEEENLINYFVDREFMNITTATNNDICEGTTAYIDGRLVEGGLPEIKNELVFDNTRENAVNLDDNNLLWIESDTTKRDYVVRNGTSMKVAAGASQTANAIGLTADKITKGNSILGIEGAAETGVELNYSLLSGNNYTIKFAENPIEFLTTSKNVFDLVEGATISTTGHYKGGGSPDAAIGNYFRKETNEVVRHKDVNNVMTYYAYFSDETLPFATALTDKSAYTTPGYYTIDYTTMSIKERVGSTLTLNFTYEMNSIRSMYQIANGSRQWIDINNNNEEQWKENFKDLIEAIYPYEETIEVKELKAKIAELEAEITEANTIIDQLNGEEV